jgi:hypothetical protein
MTTNWFALKGEKIQWLVHGLLANDSHSAIVGKPKSGSQLLLELSPPPSLRDATSSAGKSTSPMVEGKCCTSTLTAKTH